MVNEFPEESDQFRFLRVSCFANLKGVVGLIMSKASAMRISIPLDLSSRSFIPFPRFIRSRRPTQLLDPCLVLFPQCSVSKWHMLTVFYPFMDLCAHHRFNVTPFFPWFSSFFILFENKPEKGDLLMENDIVCFVRKTDVFKCMTVP